MPTFKAEIQRHHRRKDGSYPVCIRITQNRQVLRVPTGLYVTDRQINKRTFEIKDNSVIERTCITIREWEKKLLSLTTDDLLNMPVESVRQMLTNSVNKIDYLAYLRSVVDSDPKNKMNVARLLYIIDCMGIKKMYATDVTTKFVEDVKEYMLNNVRHIKRTGEDKHYTPSSINTMIRVISSTFNSMCDKYNTDFNRVITHTPKFKMLDARENRKKAMSIDELRAFIMYKPTNPNYIYAKDICLLSFFMCGLNMQDILTFKQENYDRVEKRIMYQRSKTGISVAFNVPDKVVPLIERYLSDGDKLFKIYDFDEPQKTNKRLVQYLMYMCPQIGIQTITPYWFRHTWATIARNVLRASKDDVDLCIGHAGNNRMADVYIKNDWVIVDELVQKMVDYVLQDIQDAVI